jgi:ABC-type uncharacterized transport system auxiliary subunit
MRGAGVRVFSVLVLAVALGGCGGKTATRTVTATVPAPPMTTAAGPAPTLTSAADRAACNELETNIRIVSQLISGSVEALTSSIHPKQLAKRTGDTQKNLLFASNVLATITTPSSLVAARDQLVLGLRQFAADFGRARKSVARDDLPAAAKQLVDRTALANVQASTQAIDTACGA